MLYLCLVLQSDPQLAPATNAGLASFGIKPYCVASLAAASRMLAQWHFDTLLFDADGFGHRANQLVAELAKPGVPILFVSRELSEEQQLRALEDGATEVAVKPISLRLAAMKLVRLADLQHRERLGPPSDFERGPLRIDTKRQTVHADGVLLSLTPAQFEILLLLASHLGEFVHRQTIARALRIGDPGGRSIDMHVSKIRRSLRETGCEPVVIHTVYGRGYCLTVDPVAARGAHEVEAWCA